MPAVSVIVPNYNHARFLRRRIDSILAQTFQDFELILLDDCSTDNSRFILRESVSDPRVRLNSTKSTPAAHSNSGIRAFDSLKESTSGSQNPMITPTSACWSD